MQTDFATAFLRWTFIRAFLARGYWLTTAVYLVVVAHLSPFELVMIGTYPFGYATSMMNFTEVLFVKTYRKSLNSLRRFLRHQSNYGAGIDAAGKKCSQRHFGHQTNAHSFAQ